MNPLLPVLLALVLPASAQGLPDLFKANRATWAASLEQGQGTQVRRAAEALIQQEGVSLNPADYNAMHAMVGILDLTAQACVVEGAWEDAVDYLQRATQTATQNTTTAQGTFTNLVAEHQEKLKAWREETATQERRLQALAAQGTLTLSQKQEKEKIQNFLDEHRKAIAQSEKSLKEIDDLLALLKSEKEANATSLAKWQGVLATERDDIARFGTVTTYVAQKLQQVLSDPPPPRDCLAYGRRLLKLDPSNPDCQRFVASLTDKSTPKAK